MQLIIDGWTTQPEKVIWNRRLLRSFVRGAAKRLQLNLLREDIYQRPNGLTAFGILAESSIVVHTYAPYAYVCVDLFSCKEINITLLETYVVQRLHLLRDSEYILERAYTKPGTNSWI